MCVSPVVFCPSSILKYKTQHSLLPNSSPPKPPTPTPHPHTPKKWVGGTTLLGEQQDQIVHVQSNSQVIRPQGHDGGVCYRTGLSSPAARSLLTAVMYDSWPRYLAGSAGPGGRRIVVAVLEVLLYVRRNRRLIRDGSPGRPPRLSHSS